MRVTRVTNLWEIVQGCAVGVLVAGALLTRVPLPDWCRWCDSGDLPWWICVACACCNW